MLIFKKRARRRVNATSSPSRAPSRILYVRDRLTSTRFMIDSGAEISVIPASFADRSHRPCADLTLQAANCSQISTYGQRLLTLDLGLRRRFPWVFVIADVPTALLGKDFLDAFHLVLDVARRRL